MHMCVLNCFTLCDPMEYSPPGYSVYGIVARILKCVTISYSRWSSRPRDWTWVSFTSCIGRWVLTTSATWEVLWAMCVCAKLLQLCLSLCDLMDCSPPDSSVRGILQARILEWVATPSSKGSSQFREWTCVSYVPCIGRQVFTTSAAWKAPWTRLLLFSRLVMSNSLWPYGLQASLSFTFSWSLLKLMSIELLMLFNHFILCHPLFLLPSIFPSITVFSNELALHIRWPEYWGFSLSISPSNE